MIVGFVALAAPLQADPLVAITPATLAVNSTSSATIQITGLTAPGDTVRVERFLDVNGNGLIDGGDLLVQSSLITDGPGPLIGGQRNRNVPADDDQTANSQITTPISLVTSAELGRLAGNYLVLVSSPSLQFLPVTASFAITATSDGQSISGTITSNGTTPVPHALVGLLVFTDDDEEFLWGVIANASGQYTINAPVGEYMVLPVASGYLANFETLPQVTLTTGQAATANITMTPTTRTISGKVANSANTSLGLPGMQLFVDSMDGLFAIAFTDAAGNFSFGATATAFGIEVSEKSLALLGYVSSNATTQADATSGNVTNLAINLSPVTALIYGVVTNSAQAPLANVRLWANDGQQTYNLDTVTDANGAYTLGVVAGVWHVGLDQDTIGALGLMPPQSVTVSLNAGQAVQTNFIAQAASSRLQGTVTHNGTPVPNIMVIASVAAGNGNLFVQATTNASGQFDLGVIAGTWNIALENLEATENNLVSRLLTVSVADGQTLSGILLTALSGTGTVSGTVTGAGGAPATSGNVHGYAVINNVEYVAGSEIDASGNYSFRVANGNWNVSAYFSNLTYTNQSVSISGNSPTVNFAPLTTTANFQGTVTANGAPMAGISVAANQIGGNNLFFQTTTNGNGQFDLGVIAGTWNVFVSNAADLNYATESLANRVITDGQTVSGITLRVLPTTTTISGTVTGYTGAAASGVWVIANHTVDNTTYSAGAQTDAGGNYSLKVFDGTWWVHPSGNGLNFAGRNVVVSGSATANFMATVFNQQPSSQTVSANQSISFNVQTNPPNPATLQWQVSTNGGSSWSNLTNASPYSGTTGGSLSIFPATTNLSGYQYRCVVTFNSGASSENSQAATLTVNPQSQTITFPTLPNVGYSPASITLQANSSSGLAVSYSVVSGPATLSGGNSLTLTGTGSVTVRASQIGNLIYAAATSVDRTFTVTSNFNSWLLERFDANQRADAQQTGPNADFDRDGLSNLVEYGLGLDPKSAGTAGQPEASKTETDWTFTYNRPADRVELTYAVEISTDLTNWTTTGVTHERTATGATETWRARYPLASANRLFFRLTVTQP